MRKIFAILLLPLVLLTACGTQNSDALLAQKLIDYNADKYKDMPATGEVIDGVRVIKIEARQFFWAPDLIIVNKGEKVRLIISSEDVPHGFEIEGYKIPGYDIDTTIEMGKPITIEFTADKTGVWEFICTIFCGDTHGEMKGIFVIR